MVLFFQTKSIILSLSSEKHTLFLHSLKSPLITVKMLLLFCITNLYVAEKKPKHMKTMNTYTKKHLNSEYK